MADQAAVEQAASTAVAAASAASATLADAQDTLHSAGALFSAVAWDRFIPFGMLVVMLGALAWVLFLASKRDDFDASQFLRDDRGKLSFWRLAGFICLILHGWGYMVRTQNGAITFNEQLLWGCLWSGSAVVMLGLEVYRGIRTGFPAPTIPPGPPEPVQPAPIVVLPPQEPPPKD